MSCNKKKIASKWIGLCSYQEGQTVQEKVFQEVVKSDQGQVLGFEFNTCVTLGKRANPKVDLAVSFENLIQNDISIEYVERGGHATIHSPGQVVIYPILPFQKMGFKVKEYVHFLEEVTQETLLAYGVETFKKEDPGIYTKKGKIAFLGLRLLKGVSTHGISINVRNDLSVFDNIVSCGIASEKFDRLSCYSSSFPAEVFSTWLSKAQSKMI